MARRGRRLGAVLSELPPSHEGDEADLLAALEVLSSVAAPRGGERPVAERVAQWAQASWPHARWAVTPVGPPEGACAQVLASIGDGSGGDLLVYSHLDTSLDGDPDQDGWITGRFDPAPPLVLDRDGTVHGFGLGVARAPAAAALVGFARAGERLRESGRPHAARLLLAARGTHRAGWGPGTDEPTGIESFLTGAHLPRAAVVAKCGPAGVLHDEPGAAYLRVQVRLPWGAVMARSALTPDGGLPPHLGHVLAAVEGAGCALAGSTEPGEQSGAVFGIGAVRCGRPDKPDLAAGLAEVYCYLVMPGDRARGAAAALSSGIRARLAGTPLAAAEVTAAEQQIHPGAATAADAPVVEAARAAWRTHLAASPVPVTGWTGSTDGIVLRAAGVDTVRLGPWQVRADDDGRERVDVAELAGWARVYEQLVLDLAPR